MGYAQSHCEVKSFTFGSENKRLCAPSWTSTAKANCLEPIMITLAIKVIKLGYK